MAKDSLYVVGPTNIMEGILNSPNFNNRGAVRYSLDGTQLLLEEAPGKFGNLSQHNPHLTQMTEAEAQQYLQDNVNDWEAPMEGE